MDADAAGGNVSISGWVATQILRQASRLWVKTSICGTKRRKYLEENIGASR
ncbi:hypothetical protein OSCI_1480047 [Kamptonema sp. PCC 6506]|nr:hypothetical protein OSCI_1480047 [Kamptonema sp. PCC 6506]